MDKDLVKKAIRTGVCLVCFFALFIADKIVVINDCVRLALYGVIYLAAAYDVLWKAIRNICHGKVFDENFLMTVASLGAFALGIVKMTKGEHGDFAESVAVILFYQVGEIFQDYAVGKSRKSIASLMDIRPDQARVFRDGKWVEVYPEEVSVGEIVQVHAGEKIPLDGVVIKGNTNLNTCALTGESVPVFVEEGSSAMSGTIVLDGSIDVKVEKEFYDSTVSKILDMVENASGKKAKTENFISVFAKYYTPFVVFTALARAGKVVSAWAVENGLAEAVMKMSFGNEIGFAAENTVLDWFAPMPGAIVAELSDEVSDAVRIGVTTAEKAIALGADSASIEELAALNDAVLEAVYPTKTQDSGTVESFSHETKTRVAPAVKQARPKALIPVFPGTNCEYDTQRALLEAGADAEQFIVRNLTSADVADSVERFAAAVRTAQIIVIPGGFSGGDEPDGSAKLITAFFRNAAVREQVTALLEQRDGLMLGICNGFQALIKLGLVPYGRIMDTDESFPTLTYNVIGRHQSKLVRTRVCSTRSPWLAGTEVGDIYTVPISHGEGRFLASQELIEQLAANGQIATQYAGLDGYATMDTAFNPNGSVCAIEGITSPDGRVFGKMGHSERIGPALYRNVPGTYDMHLFASAVRYFKK